MHSVCAVEVLKGQKQKKVMQREHMCQLLKRVKPK